MSRLSRKRRNVRQLEELPGLFDSVDIDMTVHDSLDREASAPRPPEYKSPSADNQDIDIDPASLKRPEELRFISFGSGSSGNCAYLGNSDGGVLIDAGVDNHVVTEGLLHNGVDIANVAGILLTHDHSDHVRYAYSLLRYNKHMALYCTPRVLGGLLRRHNISRRIKDYHKPVYKEFEFDAGGFVITPFETSHDGTDNVGFHLRRGAHAFVVATDMGVVTDRAAYYLRRARYIMLESNYDATMLREGRYPEYLKARIAGARGHMDNAVSAALVADLLGNDPEKKSLEGLSHVFLCHLSDDNNTPACALETMRETLSAAGLAMATPDDGPAAAEGCVQVSALPRYAASPLFILRKWGEERKK